MSADQSKTEPAKDGTETLSNLLKEERTFPPPAEMAANANVTPKMVARADADPEAFWAEQAKRLTWGTEPTQILDW